LPSSDAGAAALASEAPLPTTVSSLVRRVRLLQAARVSEIPQISENQTSENQASETSAGPMRDEIAKEQAS